MTGWKATEKVSFLPHPEDAKRDTLYHLVKNEEEIGDSYGVLNGDDDRLYWELIWPSSFQNEISEEKKKENITKRMLVPSIIDWLEDFAKEVEEKWGRQDYVIMLKSASKRLMEQRQEIELLRKQLSSTRKSYSESLHRLIEIERGGKNV